MLLDLYSMYFASGGGSTPHDTLYPLYNPAIIVDGVAASTEFSKFSLTLDQEVREHTTFADPARWFVPKLYTVHARGECYFQSGDGLISSKMEAGTAGPASRPMVITVAPETDVATDAYILRGVGATFDVDGDTGEILKASVEARGASGAGGGRCVYAKRLLLGAQTASSGTGTAVQLGAIATGQALRAALHVTDTTGGTTGTVFAVVSAADQSLAGATVRVTFVAGTSDVFGEWVESGTSAVTDTWWAAQWSGFAGATFTAVISAGVA